jgi:hypothetical protein
MRNRKHPSGALFQNFRKLQKQNPFVFNKDLKIARTAADLVGTPLWFWERVRRQNLTQRIANEFTAVSKRKACSVAILTAENLANPGMAELFANSLKSGSSFMCGRSWNGFHRQESNRVSKRVCRSAICFSVHRGPQTRIESGYR